MQQHRVHFVSFFPELILFIAAMRPVTNNWMKDMGKVPAQLVHAAGDWVGFDKTVT